MSAYFHAVKNSLAAMLFSNKHQIRLACITVLSFLFTSGVFAQTDVNQVVKAQNSGSDFYITIDH